MGRGVAGWLLVWVRSVRVSVSVSRSLTAMSWQGVKDRSAQKPPFRKMSALTASTRPVDTSNDT